VPGRAAYNGPVVEGLVIGLLLLVHWWGGPQRDAYEARVAALRAKGEPVRYEDLETPRVLDGDNGAQALAKASRILANRAGTEPFPFEFGAPDPVALEAAPEEREGRRAYLKSLKAYFDLLAEAAGRPRWHVDHEWAKGPEHRLPELGWLHEAGSYLHWTAALDPEDKGRAECAAGAALLCMDLGERCRPPFVLGDLVSRVMTSAYPARLLRTACGSPSISRPPHPGFDAAVFRRIVDARLAKATDAKGPTRTRFADERVFTLWAVDAFRRGGRTAIDEYLPLNGALLKSPAWRPFLYRDANRTLDLFEEAMALAATSPEEALLVARRLGRKHATKDPTCFLTQQALISVTRAFERHGQGVAVQRLMRVVMALLDYRQRKGAWPDTLDALGEMPKDPYGGKPFVYERLEGCYARIRAAKEIVDRSGKRLGEGQEWESLELDELAWTFRE
jgi:hypothetical protein